MTADTLVCLLAGQPAGHLERHKGGKLSFRYLDSWRSSQTSYPLSVSMPLVSPEHGHEQVEPFLQGLLPDDDRVLQRWGKRFQVSPHVPYGLIAAVGEDCPGAVQFVHPERAQALQEPGPSEVQWLTPDDLEERLTGLMQERSAWLGPERQEGRFSLAGAQPKTALRREGDRWGIPTGRTPSTHILKPVLPGLDGHVENEHLCLAFANHLNLPAARSEVLSVGDANYLVVERYDRAVHVGPDGHVSDLRLHQEDVCQALAIHPSQKYQNEGGPGPAEVLGLLQLVSSSPQEDIGTFVKALIFNWVIAGTDAHAKNYSLMHLPGGWTQLAPLYDLASILPYSDPHPTKAKLAMKIGGKYHVREIWGEQWARFQAASGLSPKAFTVLTTSLLASMPTALEAARQDCAGLDHPMLDRLEAEITKRIEECAKALSSGSSPD